MRKLQAFVSSLLLVTFPSTFLYPQSVPLRDNIEEQEILSEGNHRAHPILPSFDEAIGWINELENGIFEKASSLEELEKISHLVAFLAEQGQLSDDLQKSISLEEDIEELLSGGASLYENPFSLALSEDYCYLIAPAIFWNPSEAILCKSWLKKKWKQVTHFVKKHKKEIIIGTTVVLGATLIGLAIGAGAAAAATAAGGAAAAADSSSNTETEKGHETENLSPAPSPNSTPPEITGLPDPSLLKPLVDDRLTAFKEYLAQEEFFQPTDPLVGQPCFPWEESARVLGSLFAHESLSALQEKSSAFSNLGQEWEDLRSKYNIPPFTGDFQMGIDHSVIDQEFSTHYSPLFEQAAKGENLNFLSHQMRGERALSLGYYQQAIQDFGKVLEIKPEHSLSHLERGIAHFHLGDYPSAIDDYEHFVSQVPEAYLPLSPDFTLAFARGLAKGVYASGEGVMLFLADFVTHPIRASSQMVSAVSYLTNLMCNEDWALIAEALFPEMHHLVTHWETIPLEERGEQLGHVLGKDGGNFVLPGALAKLASKSVKAAKELAAVCKQAQMAQELLVLETSAGISNAAKIGEILETGQKTVSFAEELGLTTGEVGQLKQVRQLEATIAHEYEHLSLSLQDSITLHARAKGMLKPYVKKPMPELQVRELIHSTGIPTFPRPAGIPEDFLVMISEKGGGMIYMHPRNPNIQIRVMPGKLHSPNPSQRTPYVIQQRDGKAFDKHGHSVSTQDPKAHVPLEEFIYKE